MQVNDEVQRLIDQFKLCDIDAACFADYINMINIMDFWEIDKLEVNQNSYSYAMIGWLKGTDNPSGSRIPVDFAKPTSESMDAIIELYRQFLPELSYEKFDTQQAYNNYLNNVARSSYVKTFPVAYTPLNAATTYMVIAKV